MALQMKKYKMMKVVIVFCDSCGKEITDYSSTGTKEKDFHDMHAGGSMGTVEKTCYEKYLEKINEKKNQEKINEEKEK